MKPSLLQWPAKKLLTKRWGAAQDHNVKNTPTAFLELDRANLRCERTYDSDAALRPNNLSHG